MSHAPTGSPDALRREHPICFAHRGSRVLWPENTLHAFEHAVALGVRHIETDIRKTRDGVLVVFHDETLDRTTSGTGRVREHTLEELRALDAAHHFDADGGYPLRGRGVGVSTLDEVLEALPDLMFNIDLKEPGLEEPLAELLARRGDEDRIVVASFDDKRLARFRVLSGGRVPTSAGPAEVFRAWAGSRVGRAPRGPAVAFQVPPSWRVLTVVDRRFVAAAHRAGKQVHVWTIDDEAEMERLLDVGVDGIVTDRCDLMLKVQKERAGR